jgi:hypothetical protein
MSGSTYFPWGGGGGETVFYNGIARSCTLFTANSYTELLINETETKILQSPE